MTVTISNYGESCGDLHASLTLNAATNQSGVVWPDIYWSIDGGPWIASPTSAISCRGSGPSNCLYAYLPQNRPIQSGQSTLAVAIEFTSWNDSLYSFAGAIAVYDNYDYSGFSKFGLDSTNDWLLNCPSCVVDGPTVLPPGGGGTTAPPATSGRGGGTQHSASADPGLSGSASASPDTAPDTASPSVSAVTTASAMAAESTAAGPSPNPATIGRASAAASASDSVPWFVGVGIAAILASAAGALVAARKRKRGAAEAIKRGSA